MLGKQFSRQQRITTGKEIKIFLYKNKKNNLSARKITILNLTS